MIERFRQAQPKSQFAAGDETLVVTRDRGKEGEATFNLHNLYRLCEDATAQDCDGSKAEFVRKLSAVVPKGTREGLRIVVRDRQYVDYLEQMERQSKDGDTLAHRRQIGDDLYVLLAMDHADAIGMIGNEQLKDLSLSADAAWELAQRNTKAIMPPLPEPLQLKQGAMAFQDFPYLSALISDLAGWQNISDVAGADLLMTVVSEQFVFVGLMPDGAGLEKFKQSVQEDCAAQPRCISPNAYRFRDGRWVLAR